MKTPTNPLSKDERNGWPSFVRPDIQPPAGWSHELIVSIDRPRTHVISPASTEIAFYWDREDALDLYLIPVTGGWPKRLIFGHSPRPYWFDDPPRWSPDGKWIAYTHNTHIWIVQPAGEPARNVTLHTTTAGPPRWMPDSRQIVLTHDQGEFTNLDGYWPRVITPLVGRDQTPQPSPDGKFIVYAHRPLVDLDRMDIMLTDLEKGDQRTLVGLPMLEKHSNTVPIRMKGMEFYNELINWIFTSAWSASSIGIYYEILLLEYLKPWRTWLK